MWPPNPPSLRRAPAKPGRASKPPGLRSAPAKPGRSSKPRSARVALLDRCREDGHSSETDRAGHPEWKRRRHAPEDTADEGRRRDREAPDEVVEADGASAQRRSHEVDDHRLAGRLTDLAQATHDEGADQRREIVGQ